MRVVIVGAGYVGLVPALSECRADWFGRDHLDDISRLKRITVEHFHGIQRILRPLVNLGSFCQSGLLQSKAARAELLSFLLCCRALSRARMSRSGGIPTRTDRAVHAAIRAVAFTEVAHAAVPAASFSIGKAPISRIAKRNAFYLDFRPISSVCCSTKASHTRRCPCEP